ncbi:Cro/CI family transcriptional regulator [Psychromonas sp. 14N.309.X.WAT.B.A12]|uniref:Cro/CI family transcriptional regulator n=1 Tax=Psychromonas sp. 14N.309.X.WAT.B.A12 TaxID=2998322 RepID=UPI0025AF2006|nr:Cro/CI family transcriptional regulator [Psychromonas sp. 14N.309.X.WAT.B.A12]MDN2661821.1 Cro/CI family transcriptional regulator [Psychromonas sp. 14N.309.X.WAT.B.A12]
MKKIDAIKYFGSVNKLAESLNITKSAISQWPSKVPRGRACEIQILTKGKLKAD